MQATDFLRVPNRDKGVSDAIAQLSRRQWNDRLKEKERWNKILAGMLAGSLGINLILGGGSVYLGTLPKSIVETRMLDPLGYSMQAYSKEIASTDQIKDIKVKRIVAYLRCIRETYPLRKDLQKECINLSGLMTVPSSSAWRKGDDYFSKTKPYERATRESVILSDFIVMESFKDAWSVQFTETVRSIATNQILSQKNYDARVFTETRDDAESTKRTSLGFFVNDFEVDIRREEPAR